MDKNEYYIEVNRSTNTYLIKFYTLLSCLGIIIVLIVNLMKGINAQNIIKTAITESFIVLFMATPYILRKLKIDERKISHLLAIFSTLCLWAIIYNSNDKLTDWPIAVIGVVATSMMLNKIIVYYVAAVNVILAVIFNIINKEILAEHVGLPDMLQLYVLVSFLVILLNKMYRMNVTNSIDQLMQINEKNEKINKMYLKVRQSAEIVANASNEIAAGNKNLEQRTQEQASSLEETSSAIEEISATIRQNSENSQIANEMTHNASNIIEEGNKVVVQTISAMSEVNNSSKKISEIINVVNDISFQTNLLALNAAVEAARAGDQGRGFAVVATEVRNLAQRSAEAAKEIKALINDSVEKIEKSNQLVLKTGDYLNTITDSIKRISNIISEISTASIEQNAGIEEITKAITRLDSMTQQNSVLVEQASTSSCAMSTETKQLFELTKQS